MRYQFTVPGKVQPKQRPRRGKNGRWYTPSKTADYEKYVGLCALSEGVREIDGPVRLEIDIHWPDRRRRDLDNAAKSIADGLNGVAYSDDHQIAELTIRRHLDRDNPRAEIAVGRIDQ